MTIQAHVDDIFRYVVGNTLRDPIEAHFDFEGRYEVLDFGIFDHDSKKTLVQDNDFTAFCKAVSSLRSSASLLSREELSNRCYSLSLIPIKIDL